MLSIATRARKILTIRAGKMTKIGLGSSVPDEALMTFIPKSAITAIPRKDSDRRVGGLP